MAGADSLCPKLVNSSSSGGFRVTFEWLNVHAACTVNIIHSQSANNGLLIYNGGIYPPRQSVFSSEFLELPRLSPLLGNTGKYTPSKAGPIQTFTVLGQLYWAYIFPYCPVEDSGVAGLKIHWEIHFV